MPTNRRSTEKPARFATPARSARPEPSKEERATNCLALLTSYMNTAISGHLNTIAEAMQELIDDLDALATSPMEFLEGLPAAHATGKGAVEVDDEIEDVEEADDEDDEENEEDDDEEDEVEAGADDEDELDWDDDEEEEEEENPAPRRPARAQAPRRDRR